MKKLLFGSAILLGLTLFPFSAHAGANVEAPKIGSRIYTLDNDPTIEQPGRWSDITGTWHLENGSTSFNGDHRATSIPGSYCQYYLYTGDHNGAVVNLDAYINSPVATGYARYELLAANGSVAAATSVDQNVAASGWNYLNRADDFGRRDRTILVRHQSGGVVADAIKLRLQFYDRAVKKVKPMPADKEAIVNKMVNSNKNYSSVKVTFDTTRDKGTSNSKVTASNTNETGNHNTKVSVTDSKGVVTTKTFEKGILTETVLQKDSKKAEETFSANLQQKEPESKMYTLNDLYMTQEDGSIVYNNSLDVNQLSESQNVIFPINMANAYLKDSNSWNVNASESILGRDTWQIKGKITGIQSQKDASDTFTMNIDKTTGMLLSMRTYNGEKQVNKIDVTSFDVQ